MKRFLLSLLYLVLFVFVAGFVTLQLNKSPQIFEKSVAGLYHTKERSLDKDSLRIINQGELIGVADSYDTFVWMGIPYAVAPVGDLRYRAPQLATKWEGLLEANQYGAHCPQFWGLIAGVEGDKGDIIGDEDCLTLNIWAPRQAKQPLPVMLWIHGGGNDSGTANTYQAHNLAGNHDVVVVTVNYRLGLLGWFSHPALRGVAEGAEDASGNFGTLDIIQSLKWVRENIAAFGGDPNNVTIFGESAGGRNVMSLLASPLAEGLFHKAISQSGTIETTPLTMAEPYPDESPRRAISGLINSGSTLVELAYGLRNPSLDRKALRALIDSQSDQQIMATMRAVDLEELMASASKNLGEEYGNLDIANVIADGHVLPLQTTYELFKNGDYNQVPLMTGTTRDEQKVFMVRNPEYINNTFGLIPSIKDPVRYEMVSEFISKMWKTGNVDVPAAAIKENNGQAVYGYRFDWDDSPSYFGADLKQALGASHGMEINYVFGDFEGGMPFQLTYSKQNAAGRKQLATSMMDYWAAFAHWGAPKRGYSGKQVEWTAWQAIGNNILLLDSQTDGGVRMAEVRNSIDDMKQMIAADSRFKDQEQRCDAHASLLLHGYQLDDYWDPAEYSQLGCDEFPAGEFRQR